MMMSVTGSTCYVQRLLIRSAALKLAFVASEIYLHVNVSVSGSDKENATWHCNVCVLYTILVNYNIRLNWFFYSFT